MVFFREFAFIWKEIEGQIDGCKELGRSIGYSLQNIVIHGEIEKIGKIVIIAGNGELLYSWIITTFIPG